MERKTMREDKTHVSVRGDDGIYFASDLPYIREAIKTDDFKRKVVQMLTEGELK